jgi:hypothetical protein
VLGVVSPVHLGHRRPQGKLAVPCAPCASAWRGCALRIDLVSRLGCARPNSVLGWASLLGSSRLGHCGAQLNSGFFHFLFHLF